MAFGIVCVCVCVYCLLQLGGEEGGTNETDGTLLAIVRQRLAMSVSESTRTGQENVITTTQWPIEMSLHQVTGV